MAKYAISQEGASAMNALANGLLNHANCIIEASQALAQRTATVSDGLGIYADEINEIIKKNQNTLRSNREDIIGLANKVKEKADEILTLLDLGLGGSAGQAGVNGKVANSFALNRSTPRDLPDWQYGCVEDSEWNLTYDSPNETNEFLYTSQGSASEQYQGTCGLCSCANILRLSGVNLSEADMINYASNTNGSFFGKLCSTGYADPGMNGGTGPKDRQAILNHFGIDSGIIPMNRGTGGEIDDSSIRQIADNVSSGRGVIVSVHADMLWNDAPVGIDDYHAVTVTSVKKNSAGEVLGFYICDSAQGGTTYYTADKVRRCLTGAPMNVTYPIIR